MEIIRKSSEDEMIALFLHGEIKSKRFSKKLINIIKKLKLDLNIISNYDLNNETDNDSRRLILKLFRGYGNNKDLFNNFPTNINWYWTKLNKSDILKIKYIDYDYWVELTNGSRYVKDSSINILNGKEIFGVSNKAFIEGAEYLKNGGKFPPIIILSAIENNNEMIVLEGHSRLTSMNLVIDYVEDVEALIGFTNTDDLYKWNKY
jgi:hypothetical protein